MYALAFRTLDYSASSLRIETLSFQEAAHFNAQVDHHQAGDRDSPTNDEPAIQRLID